MTYETLRWKKGCLELIDQRALPGRKVYVRCRSAKDVFNAIRNMTVRGAPAIGVAGAYGVYLGIRSCKTRDHSGLMRRLEKTVGYLAEARPTAQNLFWALERMKAKAGSGEVLSVSETKKKVLKEAHAVLKEDIRICRGIGSNGAKLIKKGSTVLTHCNAGGLATAGYGTALGVIFSAKKKIKKVFVDETRPVLQGARLTAWELTQNGIPATLICDNMAAFIMRLGSIDAVLVGADRIAANGDTANKIGTYNLAVLADYHGIPFFVAAPTSTFDMTIRTGKGIPIEERSADEVRKSGGRFVTVRGMDVFNPAFDVTPAGLITAIITEQGVIRRPDRSSVRRNVAG